MVSKKRHPYMGSERFRETREAWWRHSIGRTGLQNPNGKLSDEDIRQIGILYTSGARQVDLAHRFNVGQSTISRILRGERGGKG